MIVINTPLKQELFINFAEGEGLIFIKQSGMNLFFDNPGGEDGKKADTLKKKLKSEKALAAIYFQVQAQ